MPKPEQLELSFESPAGEYLKDKRVQYPIPPPALSFLESRGFDPHTIEQLSFAHFKPSQTRGQYSHLKQEYRKKRTLDIPDHKLMRPLQRWLKEVAFAPYLADISPIACGINGRQLPEMVEPHLGNTFFLKLDVEDAYESVNTARLADILIARGDTPLEQWQAVLDRFCTGTRGGLATGAITSPLLFNLYMAPLDEQFAQIAEHGDLVVTRYMDDIVFSSQTPIGKRRAKTIKSKLGEYGLVVNQHKVRYHDLASDGPFMITGLQINPGGNWQLANRYMRSISKIIREALEEIESRGDIDLETMGVIRGLRGHLLQCMAQGRDRTKLETLTLQRYHELEKAYRLNHRTGQRV